MRSHSAVQSSLRVHWYMIEYTSPHRPAWTHAHVCMYMCMRSRPHLPLHQLMMISSCFPSITHLARVVVEICLQLPHVLAKSLSLTSSGQQDPRTANGSVRFTFIIFVILILLWHALLACSDGFSVRVLCTIMIMMPPIWNIAAITTSIILYHKHGKEIVYYTTSLSSFTACNCQISVASGCAVNLPLCLYYADK